MVKLDLTRAWFHQANKMTEKKRVVEDVNKTYTKQSSKESNEKVDLRYSILNKEAKNWGL